ncbi:MAG: AtpZ/AtpI family protein [Candidatus Krumholzibacteria bacterium]|jgi:F0F1-type ATP synthase assembly protein I|nr:AtpZ/AtpI family protein [Candidatus Krumholzibacteria bacterium]MDP6669694.1 AtpZ/AtpI family protein [Candidatus Krumholzibacteria bacterium]MDP6796564.1 AtpZ/AtpI family protein [Candidatus Krumholzibacteria bacterium]MDP7021454.1 AtpZ/AtpI family protein [Candidatus Krumholzibacteria bacterium]
MNREKKLSDWAKRWVKRRSDESASLSLSHLALTYASSLAFYGLLGWWLDRKLGWTPWLTILGVALGAVGGFVWIYREVLREEESRKKKRGSGE